MVHFEKLSDQELIVHLRVGEHGAFKEIYKRFWGLLFIQCLKILKDEDQSKDIVQEIFSTIWEKREQLAFRVTVSSYLYAAVRNRIFNLIEHGKVKKQYSENIQSFMLQGNFITDEQVRVKELKRLIESEINLLPQKMRTVFLMSRYEFLSHKQIASKLDISEKTVKTQINNALKILRSKMHLTTGIIALLTLR